jgi:hypothetical protein
MAALMDHGLLLGLGDDDHTQYLLANGSRALAGAWDMGNQALTNVNIDSGEIIVTDIYASDYIRANDEFRMDSGTAADPSLTYSSDLDTGLYRKTTDTIGFACGGAAAGDVDTTRFFHPAMVYTDYLFASSGIYASDQIAGTPTANYISLIDNGPPFGLLPSVDNTFDLGSSSTEWKDLWIDGKAYIDELGHGLNCGGFNLTSVGNISGADVDISAGTGDYSSTGKGRFDGGLGIEADPTSNTRFYIATDWSSEPSATIYGARIDPILSGTGWNTDINTKVAVGILFTDSRTIQELNAFGGSPQQTEYGLFGGLYRNSSFVAEGTGLHNLYGLDYYVADDGAYKAGDTTDPSTDIISHIAVRGRVETNFTVSDENDGISSSGYFKIEDVGFDAAMTTASSEGDVATDGVIYNSYGVRVDLVYTDSAEGHVSTNYAYYIKALSGATNNWGFYDAVGVDNYFNGKNLFGQTDGTIGVYSQADGFLDLFADSGVRIGDSSGGAPTNYSKFESDGTLEFNGNATVWNDANMGAGMLQLPVASQPDEANFVDEGGADTDISTWAFAVGEKVSGSIEIPHDYKEGSDITFHVHWQGIAAPTGTDNVKWSLDYTVAQMEATLDAATNITVETAYDTQYEFKISSFSAITGTNFNIGDQFLFTLERVVAAGDAYNGDALVATVGIHYECDTAGSRQITSK